MLHSETLTVRASTEHDDEREGMALYALRRAEAREWAAALVAAGLL